MTEPERDDGAIEWPPFPEAARRLAPAPVRYAGFFVRMVAIGFDAAILLLWIAPLTLAGLAGIEAGLLVVGVEASFDVEEVLTSLVTSAWVATAITYFTALHRGTGQTIGKALVGLRVRTLDLGALGTVRSLVRTLGYVLSSSLFFFGFLLAAITPRKRGWHDYLAGTCVVRLAPGES